MSITTNPNFSTLNPNYQNGFFAENIVMNSEIPHFEIVKGNLT
jgi:hypothetical protein